MEIHTSLHRSLGGSAVCCENELKGHQSSLLTALTGCELPFLRLWNHCSVISHSQMDVPVQKNANSTNSARYMD